MRIKTSPNNFRYLLLLRYCTILPKYSAVMIDRIMSATKNIIYTMIE